MLKFLYITSIINIQENTIKNISKGKEDGNPGQDKPG